MKSKNIIQFVLLAFFIYFAGVANVHGKASSKLDAAYLAGNTRLLLTLDEYRGLRPDQQAEYIKILTDFMNDLETKGNLQAREDRSFLKDFYAQLIRNSPSRVLAAAFSNQAMAADPSLGTAALANGDCPAGYQNKDGGKVCTLIGTRTLTGSCPAGQRLHSSGPFCYPETFYNSWNEKQKNLASAPAAKKVRVVGSAADAAAFQAPDPSATDASADKVVPLSGKGDSLTAVQAPEGADSAAAANTDAKAVAVTPENGAPSKATTRVNRDAKGDRLLPNRPLICIYAGFPVRGEPKPETKCQGVSSYMSEKTVAGKKTAYSCLSSDDFKSAIGPGGESVSNLISVSKPDPKKTILCNPMLFGLNVQKNPAEPFCIGAGKNATSACKKLSDKVEAANPTEFLKRRAQIILENPSFFEETKFTIEHLCKGNFDDELRKTLADRGRPVESSLQDIKSTCGIYQERIAESGWFTGQQSRGGKRASGNQ